MLFYFLISKNTFEKTFFKVQYLSQNTIIRKIGTMYSMQTVGLYKNSIWNPYLYSNKLIKIFSGIFAVTNVFFAVNFGFFAVSLLLTSTRKYTKVIII